MPISIPEHARLSLANPQPSFEKPRIPLEQPPNLFPVDHISDKSDRHLMRRAELAMLAPPAGVSGQPVREGGAGDAHGLLHAGEAELVGHKLGEFSPTRTFHGHLSGKGKR